MWKQHPTIYKWDKLWIGLIIGLICPFLGIPVMYIFGALRSLATQEPVMPLSVFLFTITKLQYLSKYLSIGCAVNLGAFYFLLNREYINAARGVILATLFFVVLVIINTIVSF